LCQLQRERLKMLTSPAPSIPPFLPSLAFLNLWDSIRVANKTNLSYLNSLIFGSSLFLYLKLLLCQRGSWNNAIQTCVHIFTATIKKSQSCVTDNLPHTLPQFLWLHSHQP
jgi:hypothetical protein